MNEVGFLFENVCLETSEKKNYRYFFVQIRGCLFIEFTHNRERSDISRICFDFFIQGVFFLLIQNLLVEKKHSS